ncbi:MAG: dihydrofolate reductase family protein, partial [Candidatus Hecatellaceae archaeon]
KEGLVDEVQVAISPVIIGGKDAVTLVEGEGFGSIGEARRLRLEAVEKAGFNLVLKYKVEG